MEKQKQIKGKKGEIIGENCKEGIKTENILLVQVYGRETQVQASIHLYKRG